jgi:hypothetical protein
MSTGGVCGGIINLEIYQATQSFGDAHKGRTCAFTWQVCVHVYEFTFVLCGLKK